MLRISISTIQMFQSASWYLSTIWAERDINSSLLWYYIVMNFYNNILLSCISQFVQYKFFSLSYGILVQYEQRECQFVLLPELTCHFSFAMKFYNVIDDDYRSNAVCDYCTYMICLKCWHFMPHPKRRTGALFCSCRHKVCQSRRVIFLKSNNINLVIHH